jgi:hypothetical protein
MFVKSDGKMVLADVWSGGSTELLTNRFFAMVYHISESADSKHHFRKPLASFSATVNLKYHCCASFLCTKILI